MFEPLDGPSGQLKVSVTAVTVVEAKIGVSRYTDRKVVTLQADKDIYVYFGDTGLGVPNAATVSGNGLILYKNSKESYEAGEKQPLYILSVSGTANVTIVERA